MSDLLTAMGSIYTFVIAQFANCFGVIQDNPVLYLPVLGGIFGAIILSVIALCKRLGLRGLRRRGR